MELEDAVHIALLTLKETIEGEMNGETVEIGIRSPTRELARKADDYDTGIVGAPANDLLGYEGVEGAVGPRFRKLSKEVSSSQGKTLFARKSRHVLEAADFCLPPTSVLRHMTYLEGVRLTLVIRAGDRRLPYEPVIKRITDSFLPEALCTCMEQ